LVLLLIGRSQAILTDESPERGGGAGSARRTVAMVVRIALKLRFQPFYPKENRVIWR
jgi:hypothetical protein